METDDDLMFENGVLELVDQWLERFQAVVAPHQASVTAVRCLIRLKEAGDRGLTMTEVARFSSHSTAAATGLIDGLERAGVVERFRLHTDRRVVQVRLTEGGLQFFDRPMEAVAAA